MSAVEDGDQYRAHPRVAPWEGGVVREDPMTWQLVLQLGRQAAPGFELLSQLDRHGAKVTIHSDPMLVAGTEIRIPIDLARHLMDVLVKHFGGTGDPRTLRSDYEHERGRVDRLIANLMETPR